jgi:cysteine synthase
MIYEDVVAAVGRTPLVELTRLARGLPGRVLAKLECRNPGGSIKDRLAVALIDDAEQRELLRPGMTIVEPTGGNTGVGLAMVAAVRGYRLVLTMPEAMSVERVALLRQLGAEVVLTAGILMRDAVDAARRLVETRNDAIMLDQFSNPANAEIHRRTTAVELWEDSGGAVDVFVSAVGTGGTITGIGDFLKQRNPKVRVVAVEPAGSAVLSGGDAGPHQMPGIGVGSSLRSSIARSSTRFSSSRTRKPFPARGASLERKASWRGSPPARQSTRRFGWQLAPNPKAPSLLQSCPTRASATSRQRSSSAAKARLASTVRRRAPSPGWSSPQVRWLRCAG